MNVKKRCFICRRPLQGNPYPVVKEDGSIAHVGVNCYAKVGPSGYRVVQLGLSWGHVYRGRFSPAGELLSIIKEQVA